MPGKLRVTQTKSTISHIARNRATIRALGLKRIGHTVEVADNPATRGMVRQVRFLVTVEEVPGTGKGAAAASSEDRAGTRPSEQEGDTPASRRTGDSEEKA